MKKRPPMFSNDYILGWVMLLTSMYFLENNYLLSTELFGTGAIYFFVVDLFKKAKYVQEMREEVKRKIKEEKDKEK